jgi:hypothetical protein
MRNSYISNFSFFLIKVLSYALLVILSFAIVLEFYNPLSIVKNKSVVYRNNEISDLPEEITVNYNNNMYIGEDWSDTISRIKVCFVGSSRTQSIYVPYDLQWSNLIFKGIGGVWGNNCGKDGQTIEGWIKEIYNLKNIEPNFVIVLVDPFQKANFEQSSIAKKKTSSSDMSNEILNFCNNIAIYKSIIVPLINISANSIIKNKQIGHRSVVWELEEKQGNIIEEHVNLDSINIIKTLDTLVSSIYAIGSVPILISCPTPYGNYVSENGVDIGLLKGSISKDNFFKKFAHLLKFYCENKRLSFVDGYLFPKGTQFFYDYSHFNVLGSQEFAKFIEPTIKKSVFSDKIKSAH